MSIDIWTDSMQHAELFGKPVLFTNWLVQRDTIPKGGTATTCVEPARPPMPGSPW